MNKLVWCLKQLFPLKYDTVYTEGGKRKVSIWRMWFGRCFQVKRFVVEGGTEACSAEAT